jgi:hypothetical protein
MANNLEHFRRFTSRALKLIMRTSPDLMMRMKAYGILIERRAFDRRRH